MVADELARRGRNVTFVGSSSPIERRIVPERGYPLWTIHVSGLPRRPCVGQLRAVIRAVWAVVRAAMILRRARPDVVLAGGGFVAAPVAVAARVLGVPVVATEADAHLGLANRIAARHARVLCAAYPLPEHRGKQLVTGRPIEPAFASLDRGSARERLGIDEDARLVAVVGGSGGALHLSEAAYAAFAVDPTAGGEPIHVVHVTGRRDFATFVDRGGHSGRYRLVEYCDDMPALLHAADVVVSRSGGSVFEVAAVGVASVLVPFPAATGDHQSKNAAYFGERGAAVVLPDSDCDATALQAEIDSLLGPGSAVRREQIAGECRKLARPDAAARVADAVDAVLAGTWEPMIASSVGRAA